MTLAWPRAIPPPATGAATSARRGTRPSRCWHVRACRRRGSVPPTAWTRRPIRSRRCCTHWRPHRPARRVPGWAPEQAPRQVPETPAPCVPLDPGLEPDVPPRAPRDRLLRRVAASAANARRVHTLRHADSVARPLAAGAQLRLLYRAEAGQGRRPGEPERVALVELSPGAAWRRGA